MKSKRKMDNELSSKSKNDNHEDFGYIAVLSNYENVMDEMMKLSKKVEDLENENAVLKVNHKVETNILSREIKELQEKNEATQAESNSVQTTSIINWHNAHQQCDTQVKHLCDFAIASQTGNITLKKEFVISFGSGMRALNDEVLKLRQELLKKNNDIRKVNGVIQYRRELLDERERLFAFKSYAKETIDYMKQEGEKMGEVMLSQGRQINELEREKKTLSEQNNNIQKVNDELIKEKESLRLAIMNNSKDAEAETEELKRKNRTMKKEIEKLNGLVQRQRKTITETQNSSRSKNEKIKMLSSEKKILESEIRRLKEVSDVAAQPSSKTQAELECNICLDECAENCWIFAPCGHYACGDCARQLTSCQTCRVKITSKIKLFL